MRNFRKKIVVTGIGLISPLGLGRERTWSRLVHGETGIESTPEGLFAVVPEYSENKTGSRVGDMALSASVEALHHAGVDFSTMRDKTIGCAVSHSKPILTSPLDPALLLSSFTDTSTEVVIKKNLGFSGPTLNVVAACATGVASIEVGASWIHSGFCSMALVGAAESSLHPLYIAGFEKMGVLAKGDSPQNVCPFDRGRTGFAMGEGAAVLLLEDAEAAKKRGQEPLAELQHVVIQHGAIDPVRFSEGGGSISRLIKKILNGTGSPGYINAHGTGTKLNDIVEAQGIQHAFGQELESISISSTKAATGHLLGAAGAIEAAFSVLALRDQVVPPTLHLTKPDPECPISVIANSSQPKKLKSSLSLSYGFGGQQGAVLFSKV